MRLSESQQRLAAILGPLDGREIAGGCDECDAYQTVAPEIAGVWTITIHHDEDCSVLAHHRRRRTR